MLQKRTLRRTDGVTFWNPFVRAWDLHSSPSHAQTVKTLARSTEAHPLFMKSKPALSERYDKGMPPASVGNPPSRQFFASVKILRNKTHFPIVVSMRADAINTPSNLETRLVLTGISKEGRRQ